MLSCQTALPPASHIFGLAATTIAALPAIRARFDLLIAADRPRLQLASRTDRRVLAIRRGFSEGLDSRQRTSPVGWAATPSSLCTPVKAPERKCSGV
jgi:hypothetical protein